MIFKQTQITNVDRCGPHYTRVIHTYHKLKRRFCSTGEYVKTSVLTLKRWPVRIRGKRYRPIKPGFVIRGLNCLNKFNTQNCNNLKLTFSYNAMITLKKRGVIRSPHIFGPIGRPIRVKKFFYIFGHLF